MYTVHVRTTHITRRLGPETIVEQALAIIDADGPGRVSMRRLADQLGVTAMALYNHVEDKQAVLDAVADRVLGEIDLPADHLPWPDRIVGVFTQLRAVYLRHPNAMVVVQAATRPSATMLGPMESVLRALDDAGLGPMAALEAWAGLVGLTNGHTAYQVRQHLAGDTRTLGPFASADFPAITHALNAGVVDWDRAFHHTLEAHIEALHQRARS